MTSLNDQRRQIAFRLVSGIPDLGPNQRRMLQTAIMQRRWRVLLHEKVARPPAGEAAVILVSRAGVLAADFVASATPQIGRAAAIRHDIERRLQSLRFAREGRAQGLPSIVDTLLLMLDASGARGDGRFIAADAQDLDSVLLELPHRRSMRADQVAMVVSHLTESGSPYRTVAVSDPTVPASDCLFTTEELSEQQRELAVGSQFQNWASFLDEELRSLVTRNFAGPARICGPAGTGKTVVALHRMARHARNIGGPMLFTTFARNLIPYCERAYQKIAPLTSEDHAEFVTLHSWAMSFLNRRDVRFNLRPKVVDAAFEDVWSGAEPFLARYAMDSYYWRAEIDRVIKGRGIVTLTEYQATERKGREGVGLDDDGRRVVWEELYKPYEDERGRRRVHDYADVIALALREIENEPLEERYSLVVVDEVQDLPLIGVRLAHEIAGGGDAAPLLLVGDSQQRIYAGGWSLAEAKVKIRGRGAVLRTNLRNRAKVLQHAVTLDTADFVDDLDDNPGVSLREASTTLDGGRIVVWRGTWAEAAVELVDAVRSCESPSDCAVIAMTNDLCEDLLALLNRAKIAAVSLEDEDWLDKEGIRVGTIFRSKGLDFSSVFHLATTPRLPRTPAERDYQTLDSRRRLVAATRPRDNLWLGTLV